MEQKHGIIRNIFYNIIRGGNMYDPSNNKIEKRAIGALQNIINEDLTMDYQFNSMDKEMAWDGSIYIFKKNNGDQSKRNLDDKVPVQIKGHIDKDEKYLDKERISFAVDLIDLEIYHNDRGVVYFEIFMTKKAERIEIYYSLLFPSKIKGYLNKVAQKGNKATINISFNKLEKTPEKLYVIVKQFSQESKRQGFGLGEIVQNTIMAKDLDKVTSITATAIGVSNELEFMQRLSTGDICFYGTTKENQIKVPITWEENSKHYLQHQVDNSVSIDGIIYYDRYSIILSSAGEKFLVLSENLNIELDKGRFHIVCKTGIKQFGKDAHFVLELIKNKNFVIGNTIIKYNNFNLPAGCENELKFMDDLHTTLNEIEVDYDKPFFELPINVRRQLIQIVAIRNKAKNSELEEKVSFFNWEIEDKYMPVIIIKRDDGSGEVINGVFSKREMAVKNDKGEYYKVPLFGYTNYKILANLYYYNYVRFYEQIDDSDVNIFTVDVLNYDALQLIKAYDINGDGKLLDIADYQLQKIEKFEKDKIDYIINKLQIEKRRGLFSDKEITLLKGLNTENPYEIFAISVLLAEKEKAIQLYNQMEEEDQEVISEYPIYYLFRNL